MSNPKRSDYTTLLKKLAVETILRNGITVDHGMGHVVKVMIFDGVTLEADRIDRGDGRRAWVDKGYVDTVWL